MNIVTLPHKVQPSRYALRLMFLWARRNGWWAFGIPVAMSLLLAAMVDIKFVYIAVIMVCLVLPHVFVMVYWRHLLSDRTCRWLLPHTVTFNDGSMTVDYLCDESDDGVDRPPRDSFSIPCESVSDCHLTDDGMLLRMSDTPYHIVIIPADAFQSPADYMTAFRKISDK